MHGCGDLQLPLVAHSRGMISRESACSLGAIMR